MKKILVIGGGTGTFTVLSGLKHYAFDLSVIVSMTDSGGSNRILRDEFGILPTSDLRQCIVALASEETDLVLRQLFTYRYSNGIGIAGMTFGNLFMAALADIYGSQKKAIEKTCEMFGVTGQIIPSTYDNSHLIATYEDGSKVLGEHYIDEPNEKHAKLKITHLETIPEAKSNPQALKAIEESDLIILGPGDLYTSIICNLTIEGFEEALKNTKAKKLYVMNLMTKPGQTHGFRASDHLKVIEQYAGKIDYCLVNQNTDFPKEQLLLYKEWGSTAVQMDIENITSSKVIKSDIVSKEIYQKHKNDKLIRSLIRHDPHKLAKAIAKLI